MSTNSRLTPLLAALAWAAEAGCLPTDQPVVQRSAPLADWPDVAADEIAAKGRVAARIDDAGLAVAQRLKVTVARILP